LDTTPDDEAKDGVQRVLAGKKGRRSGGKGFYSLNRAGEERREEGKRPTHRACAGRWGGKKIGSENRGGIGRTKASLRPEEEKRKRKRPAPLPLSDFRKKAREKKGNFLLTFPQEGGGREGERRRPRAVSLCPPPREEKTCPQGEKKREREGRGFFFFFKGEGKRKEDPPSSVTSSSPCSAAEVVGEGEIPSIYLVKKKRKKKKRAGHESSRWSAFVKKIASISLFFCYSGKKKGRVPPRPVTSREGDTIQGGKRDRHNL